MKVHAYMTDNWWTVECVVDVKIDEDFEEFSYDIILYEAAKYIPFDFLTSMEDMRAFLSNEEGRVLSDAEVISMAYDTNGSYYLDNIDAFTELCVWRWSYAPPNTKVGLVGVNGPEREYYRPRT